jgi:methylmalonyl-CoA mutase
MADIACGSYYIETCTDNIASKALEAFKYFESEGGYLKCIEKNIFKSTIAKQAALKEEEINSNKQVVIGVNKFKNDKELVELSDLQMKEIEGNGIQNPVLNYELHNKKSHA